MFVFPIDITLIRIVPLLSLIDHHLNSSKMRTAAFIILLILPFSILAQDYAKLGQAFTDGNTSAVGKWLSPLVDLSLEGKTQSLGRGDCKSKIQAFFNENSPRSFTKVHEGVSGNDVHYMIGELSTSTGIYRVTVYLQKSGEEFEIQSMEIDK